MFYIYSLSLPLYHLQGLHLQSTTSTLMAWRLPRHQPTGSWWLPFPLTTWPWIALHES
jgi:hypothetical protein